MLFQFTEKFFAEITKAGGKSLYDQVKLGTLELFTNAATPGWTSVIADFSLAAYTGYTPIDLVSGLVGPYNDAILQNMFVKLPMHSFGQLTALPETEFGVMLKDTATGLIVWGAALFDAPIAVPVNGIPRVNMLFPIGQGEELSGVEMDVLFS